MFADPADCPYLSEQTFAKLSIRKVRNPGQFIQFFGAGCSLVESSMTRGCWPPSWCLYAPSLNLVFHLLLLLIPLLNSVSRDKIIILNLWSSHSKFLKLRKFLDWNKRKAILIKYQIWGPKLYENAWRAFITYRNNLIFTHLFPWTLCQFAFTNSRQKIS